MNAVLVIACPVHGTAACVCKRTALLVAASIALAIRASNWPEYAGEFTRPVWRGLGSPELPPVPLDGLGILSPGLATCVLDCGHSMIWEEDDARSGAPIYCVHCAREEES